MCENVEAVNDEETLIYADPDSGIIQKECSFCHGTQCRRFKDGLECIRCKNFIFFTTEKE